MSTQTVYFNNPADIVALQNATATQTSQITSMSGSVVILQNQVGTSPSNFPTDTISWLTYTNYLNNQLAVTKGNGRASNTTGAPTISRDLNGTGSYCVMSMFGNIYTGQEMIIATGSQDALGTPISADSMFNIGSNGKMLSYMIAVKMMQEGYFLQTETVSKYAPQFTGFGWAWASASGSASNSYIDDPTTSSSWSFTGTLARVGLSTLTIAQALGMQIHFPYMSTTIASVAGKLNTFTAGTSSSDWGVIYSSYLAGQAVEFGRTLGATGACQLFAPALGTGASSFVMGTGALRNFNYNFMYNDTAFCTGPYTDQLNTCINCIKAGVVPMGFVPGTDIISQQGIYGPRSIYNGFSLLLLQAVCANSLQAKQGTPGFPASGTYPTLLSYVRNKILEPCDITPANSSFPASEGTTSVTSPYMDNAWRRAYVMSTGWYGSTTNADPTYLPVANSLVWTSQYPNDGISLYFNNIKNVIANDPLSPNFEGNFFITPRKFLNLVKMILNKGVYNGNRIFTRSYWNYMTTAAVSLGVNVFETSNGLSDNIGAAGNYTLLGVLRSNSSFNSISDPPVNNFSNSIQETSSTVSLQQAQSASPSSNFWTGIFGSLCVFDFDTGNYILYILPQIGYGAVVNTPSAYTQMAYLAKYI
jgi:CubicO group peptidase (beta-lactamase class C family)